MGGKDTGDWECEKCGAVGAMMCSFPGKCPRDGTAEDSTSQKQQRPFLRQVPTRLSDGEVWLRAWCALIANPAEAPWGTSIESEADRCLEEYKSRFSEEPV